MYKAYSGTSKNARTNKDPSEIHILSTLSPLSPEKNFTYFYRKNKYIYSFVSNSSFLHPRALQKLYNDYMKRN